VFKYAGIIFGGSLVLLAGCTGVYQGSEAPPPNEWTVTTNTVVPPPPRRIPPVLKPIPAPPKAIAPPAPIVTWTSLDRWALANQLTAPRKVTDSPVTSYAVSSRLGTLALEIGSREAEWNGIELHLGFAPEIIDDQVFVHGLDLQKNLAPLLLGGPFIFGTNRVIVLDPGHGGAQTGTTSVLDGRPEKEFTLDWARRLKPLLEAGGWTVFLTRTNDTDLSLSNRVDFAEAHHAALFISLHFNSPTERTAATEKQSGLETYRLTPRGMPSTLVRDPDDHYYQVYPNQSFDVQNLQLAVRLHRAVLLASGEADRGVRTARFMGVLRRQNRPAVLIEGGYLSNPSEARKIANPGFRQQLAVALADALRRNDHGTNPASLTH